MAVHDAQRNKKNMIRYPASTLLSFEVTAYEWIDNLNFTLDVRDCIDHPDDYLQIAQQLFREAGWHGDGRIELMWLPPFVLEALQLEAPTEGAILWHVKQEEDGISWLLGYPELIRRLNQL